ncbi:uncharacterized protein BO66DRAFT_164748 [Aspergillus aculeatinus CBS 121060]|uniref:Uncharacterized protein n=1 Tax=Aspergillus aculeatinus CBS 121060 TaxID=1448322 RepID=A0ACD1H075_9EURO|nr:hypothetical protein BO66DRAFT_164748 [Aspergillus aculeatinus CBS 121060]RAH66953.1 hypothetical protein BO66DRAFT_164748 [Aspergillus aculeatinus CBS 121060]
MVVEVEFRFPRVWSCQILICLKLPVRLAFLVFGCIIHSPRYTSSWFVLYGMMLMLLMLMLMLLLMMMQVRLKLTN